MYYSSLVNQKYQCKSVCVNVVTAVERYLLNESAHEIMALFVLRKRILHTRMRSRISCIILVSLTKNTGVRESV